MAAATTFFGYKGRTFYRRRQQDILIPAALLTVDQPYYCPSKHFGETFRQMAKVLPRHSGIDAWTLDIYLEISELGPEKRIEDPVAASVPPTFVDQTWAASPAGLVGWNIRGTLGIATGNDMNEWWEDHRSDVADHYQRVVFIPRGGVPDGGVRVIQKAW